MTIQIKRQSWEPADYFDIRSLLGKYRQWHDLQNSKLFCSVCEQKVKLNNLGTAFEDKLENKVILVCNSPICLRKYLRHRSEVYYQ